MRALSMGNKRCKKFFQYIGGLVFIVLSMGPGLPAEAETQWEPGARQTVQTLEAGARVTLILTLADRVDPQKLSRKNREAGRIALVRTLRDKAKKSQSPLSAFLKAGGVKEIKSLWMINSLAVTAEAGTIRGLADLPGVESVRLNRIIRQPEMQRSYAAVSEWNIGAVGADQLWPLGFQGQGMVVATLDTGADLLHADLLNRWRGGSNSWFDPNGEHASPADITFSGIASAGHGTAVMGLILGGDNSGANIGVAPRAQWIAVKIFNDQGLADYVKIHEGFQWLLDPDQNPATDDAPDVVNNSWGLRGILNQCAGQSGYDEFHPDIQILKAAGIAVVFSGGNDGPAAHTSISPANDTEVVSAGAVDASLLVAGFSSRGPSGCGLIYPTLTAPGVNVRTADLTFGGLFPKSYITVTGTSFAAPHVSGSLALLMSAFSGATPLVLEQALRESAADGGEPGPDNSYGYGLLNVFSAFERLQAAGFQPCVRPEARFQSEPYPGTIGRPIVLSSTVNGGTGPYTYAWDVNGDGLADFNTSGCTQVYAAFYNGSIGLTVTDANGCSSKTYVADNWAVCAPITANIVITPNPARVGEAVLFSSDLAGGATPYQYEWDLDNDGQIDCNTAQCAHTYPNEYTGPVSLRARDSSGCRADPQVRTLTVQADPQPGASSGGGGGGCFISAGMNGYIQKFFKYLGNY